MPAIDDIDGFAAPVAAQLFAVSNAPEFHTLSPVELGSRYRRCPPELYVSVCGLVVAQHPPDARRPLRRRRAVEDDAARIADPEPAHRGGELLGVRHHKAELRVLRREIGL